MPLSGSRAKSHITIKIPDATTPNALQGLPDNRTLGVALHSIDLKVHKSDLKDTYPIVVSDKEPSAALIDILGPGWNDFEETHVWSKGRRVTAITCPRKNAESGACSAILTLKAYGASEERPVKVLFKTGSKDAPLVPPLVSQKSVNSESHRAA